jgi:hypothetical protein
MKRARYVWSLELFACGGPEYQRLSFDFSDQKSEAGRDSGVDRAAARFGVRRGAGDRVRVRWRVT